MKNINLIINYLNKIKKNLNTNQFNNIINILIDLLKTKYIPEFLRRYDIFIKDIIFYTKKNEIKI